MGNCASPVIFIVHLDVFPSIALLTTHAPCFQAKGAELSFAQSYSMQNEVMGGWIDFLLCRLFVLSLGREL